MTSACTDGREAETLNRQVLLRVFAGDRVHEV